MRVTVTGGAGFVGSAIVRTLLDRRHHVRVVDDYSTGRAANLEGVACDNHAIDAGEADYSGCDVVVHAAAYPDVSANWNSLEERKRQKERNADLTWRVLERVPEGIPFILLSTCSVYGAGIVGEESLPYATSPYAASKLAAEHAVTSFHEPGRVRAAILRLVNVVGARYQHGHLADFVRMAHEKKAIHALDDGAKRKSFVHVEDVADAVRQYLWILSAKDQFWPKAFVHNVTSPVLWSWRDSVEVMFAMRPEKIVPVTCEDRPSGWVGDPAQLEVKTTSYRRRSIVAGVRAALLSLGW
jgi:UDP-glucose 4-epimerase